MPSRDRFIAGAAALTIEAGLIALLLFGLGASRTIMPAEALRVFDIAPPPPPRSAVHMARAARRESGRAAAPNPVVRPAEPTPLPVVTPAVPKAAAVAAPGTSAGASAGAGAGTGAGGSGNGVGGGGDGGDGGGGTPPRLVKGRIKDSDYPHDLWLAGIGGTVGVRYTVEVDGRIGDCGVTASSGNAELDAVTCHLIQERFRFRPALDDAGRPVRSIIVENHSWIVDRTIDPGGGQP